MPRPRKHPVGTTPSQRANDQRTAFQAAGGRAKQFRLSAVALADLKHVREAGGDASDSAAVERALRLAAGRT